MPEIAASGRPDVLYVEDRSIHILLMQALFEQLPARLIVAQDAAQAVELARGLRPRLLLLDPELPAGDGAGLLKRLRDLSSCRDAHAVAVTADARADFAHQGFAETWLKPLDLRRVLARLRQLLDSGSALSWAPGAAA